jgi:transposase
VKKLCLYTEVLRDGEKPLGIYRGEECGSCLVRAKFTKGTVRTVSRDGQEDLMGARKNKLKAPEGKKTYQKRMYTVEPVFGNMEENQGKIALSLRGLIKVKEEFLLSCLVNNIRKIVRKVLASAIALEELRLARTAGVVLAKAG